MLLELGGTGALDRPVPGVVRPHRELVDQQPVGGVEQLDGEQAHHVQLGSQPDGQPLRLDGAPGVQGGRRGEHLHADPVPLYRLDHRVRRHLPVRGPGHQRRQFPAQRYPLLDDELGQVGQLRRGLDHPDAPPVVPPAHRLDHDGPAGLRRERADVRAGCPPRHRYPQLAQPFPHRPLVLREAQRRRPGQHPVPVGGQRLDVLLRYVLVVEGDHVAALREGAQRVQVGVPPDVDVRGDQRRAVVGRNRQYAQ